jgi:hypothetical protein
MSTSFLDTLCAISCAINVLEPGKGVWWNYGDEPNQHSRPHMAEIADVGKAIISTENLEGSNMWESRVGRPQGARKRGSQLRFINDHIFVQERRYQRIESLAS